MLQIHISHHISELTLIKSIISLLHQVATHFRPLYIKENYNEVIARTKEFNTFSIIYTYVVDYTRHILELGAPN